MNSHQIRKKFLDFYKKRNHKIMHSSSLIPDDQSVLFTTAGMQQFKDFYLGKESPYGSRVATIQKCFRTSDIEEVGDKDHLTFLEMLGNFSFGDYFKKEAISWAFQFLTEECNLDSNRFIFTYFKGTKEVPCDKESKNIWLNLGASENQLESFGMEDNFWGPTGQSGPCGPTTEIHYDLSGKPCGTDCDLKCDCGRYVEIWNLVFNQYFQDEKGQLTLLQQPGVDTGMGLERLAMACQGKRHLFKTDLFVPLFKKITELDNKNVDERIKRIIIDHIRGACFLISEGVKPSNTERGYILRRVLRRAMRYRILFHLPEDVLEQIAAEVFNIYKGIYFDQHDLNLIYQEIKLEKDKFEKVLNKGLNEFEKSIKNKKIDGKTAFRLYSTYGFPFEMIKEICKERNVDVSESGFQEAMEKHKCISRQGAEKKFGGVGKNPAKEEVKLHTATHLLHESLRRVLGDHVSQKGSDINSERLRFDFAHPKPMTPEEIKKVEDLVNQAISKNLRRVVEKMNYKDAINAGALSFFDKDQYPEEVTVYSFVDDQGKAFSKELCRGPHVEKTSELGIFQIQKEKSSSKGIRRIKAILK